MNIAQAKKLFSLEDVLRHMGAVEKSATPDRSEVWYLSPLRDEKTASFKIDNKKQVWHDHGGIGEGGDMLKLVQRYLAGSTGTASVSEALQWLKGCSATTPPEKRNRPSSGQKMVKQEASGEEDKTFKLVKEKIIFNRSLIAYIQERKLPIDLVRLYAKEVYAKSPKTGKQVFGIGIKNDLGGYDLRGAVGTLKVPVESKAITTLIGSHHIDTVNILEGQFDFYTMVHLCGQQENEGVIILHGAKLWRHAVERLKNEPRFSQVKTVRTWMQNDDTGQLVLAKIAGELQGSYEIQDKTPLYKTVVDKTTGEAKEFKDLNAWWIEFNNYGDWPDWAPPKPRYPSYTRGGWEPCLMPAIRRP